MPPTFAGVSPRRLPSPPVLTSASASPLLTSPLRSRKRARDARVAHQQALREQQAMATLGDPAALAVAQHNAAYEDKLVAVRQSRARAFCPQS